MRKSISSEEIAEHGVPAVMHSISEKIITLSITEAELITLV